MNELEKYAVYDFCQTICTFETADEFVGFVCQKKPSDYIKRKQRYIDKLYRFHVDYLFNLVGHFFHFSINKKILLSKLKGMRKEELEEYSVQYYNEKIRGSLIPEVIESIKQNKNSGLKIAVVSASYDIFLKHFVKEFGIDLLVTNTFKYTKNNIFEGRITKPDCIYKNKVKYFYKKASKEKCRIQKSYGDSKNDIPILLEAEHGIVISHNYHKEWTAKFGFKEIIWK